MSPLRWLSALRRTLVQAALLLVGACSLDTSPAADPPRVDVRGSVQKGPFALGSSVTVYPADDRAHPDGRAFPTQTSNALGEFELSVPHRGLAFVEARGFHYPEATGNLSHAPRTLRARARAARSRGHS